MFTNLLLLLSLLLHPGSILGASSVELASRTFSMEDRYDVPSVNTVFKDNILLTLKYMDGDIKGKNDVNWSDIEKPFNSEFTLNPGAGFAFHDNEIPAYSKNVVKTTNSHYMSFEVLKVT